MVTWKPLLVVGVAVAFGSAVAACGGGTPGNADVDVPDNAASVASATTEAPARLASAEFGVDGMTCGGCALATELALKKLDGVTSADASFDEDTQEGSCSVRYDPELVTTTQMIAAIEDVGFQPRLRATSESE